MVYYGIMKNCITCRAEKPLSEYYRHPMMKDGHLNKCKACVIAYQRSRVAEPKIKKANKEYEKRRAMLPHRVESRKKYQQTPEGKLAIRRAHEKQKKLYPKKRAARI